MVSETGAGNLSVSTRQREHRLLFYGGLYLWVGVLTLYLGMDHMPHAYMVVAGALGTFVGFLSLSWLWRLTGFRADPYLLPIITVLISTGLVFLLRLQPHYAIRQFAWLLVALVALALVTTLFRNYHLLSEYRYIYALLGVIALVVPIFFGEELGGAKRWLELPWFQVQTSEFVKIVLVLFLASYLAENKRILTTGTGSVFGIPVPSLREWGPMLVMWGIALVLLVFQRDLGTALIYFCTFLAMLYVATARIFYILFGLTMFIIGAFICYLLFFHVQVRVDIWLNPWPLYDSYGYQIIQSLFAMGSGGVLGSGLGAGRPDLIPAAHTDFIFAAISEEMGLLGGAGIILLFILLIYRGLRIALEAKDDFSALLAAGLTALMGLQVFIILAGVMKLLPLTGITLPFISYGGSSLVANSIILGLLLNVSHKAVVSNEK
ncbi:FtsW/RodA/SpoVE family cell cycle protein [Desulfofalx alkaliphila]|uniref:FtsW/RodA/SpoVE family cell cycle protein n=1 Tax=Desulfofalx alkaliphila TaxID=105483 RepID=UPI0004E21C54|nr:FtsW/RodA/SpoVE family cell cycle protein [Desulfofalx alkaliphila]